MSKENVPIEPQAIWSFSTSSASNEALICEALFHIIHRLDVDGHADTAYDSLKQRLRDIAGLP